MTIGREEIEALVRTEIGRIEQTELLRVVHEHLVPVRCEQREWDYGEPRERHRCWIVWEHAPSATVVGYCEHGFGLTDPWGLLSRSVEAGLGTDAQWYATLEDAVRESCAWDGENPPGYEVD